MRQLDGARTVLLTLVKRCPGTVKDASQFITDRGFTPLVDVVGDTGRALEPRDPHDLRMLLPALSALQEVIWRWHDGGAGVVPPSQALQGPDARAYAAGALWATSEIIASSVEQQVADDGEVEGRRGRREVHEVILELMTCEGMVRNGEIMTALEKAGQAQNKSVVSRALRDLMEAGVIEPTEAAPSGDRRHRYYRPTDRAGVDERVRNRALRLVAELLSWKEPDWAKRWLSRQVDYAVRQGVAPTVHATGDDRLQVDDGGRDRRA